MDLQKGIIRAHLNMQAHLIDLQDQVTSKNSRLRLIRMCQKKILLVSERITAVYLRYQRNPSSSTQQYTPNLRRITVFRRRGRISNRPNDFYIFLFHCKSSIATEQVYPAPVFGDSISIQTRQPAFFRIERSSTFCFRQTEHQSKKKREPGCDQSPPPVPLLFFAPGLD